MKDVISREAAVNAVHNVPKGNWSNARYAHELQAVPAADVAPVVHGRWIKKDILHCSECDMPTIRPWPYCQNCWAKMDGGQEKREAQKRDLENARRSMDEAIATPVVDVTRWQYPQLTEEAKQKV